MYLLPFFSHCRDSETEVNGGGLVKWWNGGGDSHGSHGSPLAEARPEIKLINKMPKRQNAVAQRERWKHWRTAHHHPNHLLPKHQDWDWDRKLASGYPGTSVAFNQMKGGGAGRSRGGWQIDQRQATANQQKKWSTLIDFLVMASDKVHIYINMYGWNVCCWQNMDVLIYFMQLLKFDMWWPS